MAALPTPKINLSQLSSATTALTALSNLVLVSPQSTVGYQPQNPTSTDGQASLTSPPPKFLFDYEGEQTVTLDSDITDHYVEDNTAVQDQISLKPVVITTHGFIGELNDVPPLGLQTLKAIADKLTAVTAYAPGLTTTAQLAYAEAFQAYQVIENTANAAVSSASSIKNLVTGSIGQATIENGVLSPGNSQNAQQVAFQQFYGFWRARTLFTVQTPWAVFKNMAIKTIRAIQDAETHVITDFDITFKVINVASTLPRYSAFTYSGRAIAQAQPVNNLGTTAMPNSIGLTDGIASMGVA